MISPTELVDHNRPPIRSRETWHSGTFPFPNERSFALHLHPGVSTGLGCSHRIEISSVPAVSENPQMICFWSLVRVKFRKLMYSLSVKNTSTFWTWWNRNMAFVKEIISIRTEVVTIFVGQNYVRFDFVEFARVNKSLVQPKKHRLFIVIMKV